MDKEIQPEEAILLDWTTAVEALDFPTIQELYKEKPDLLWTPLEPSSHLESDFAHFIDRLKKFEILGDNIRPLFALHHVLLDYGLPEDEWAPERSELVDFFLESSTAIQLNNFFWGSEQNTVLHLAYFIQQPTLVKKLLEKGALPSIPNKSGHLPEQKIDPITIDEREDIKPQLLKNNKQSPQKDERKPQNVSDRFKRLRELAESPNVKKPLSERQNSTRKYFRPGHIEERKRKVLTEEEIELEKQKQRRQKEVEMLAQRSAVKNNPLFKKFEQQQSAAPTPKSIGPSGNVASAIKSRQALLDGDQIRRNSRVISSLKDRSVVSTSVFRQQKQAESLTVPTLDQLRAASPTFKKSSLDQNIAESDNESEDENNEAAKNTNTQSSADDNVIGEENINANNATLLNDGSNSEDNSKPEITNESENSMDHSKTKSNESSIHSVQVKKETGEIGVRKLEKTTDEPPLSVGKLAARNLSAESITKQKKFSGIISNKVKNIIDVHEHLNDKEDVEIEVLGKKFAVWNKSYTGDETQDVDDASLSTSNSDAAVEKEVAKNSKKERTIDSSSSSISSVEQRGLEKEAVVPETPSITVGSEEMAKNSNESTFNSISTKTSTFADNELPSEKSGDFSNKLNLSPHKIAETNALGTSATGASVKQTNASLSNLSEESLVDSLLVGNRDSSSHSFFESQTSSSVHRTKTEDGLNSEYYNGSGSNTQDRNTEYTSDIQKSDLNKGFKNTNDFKMNTVKSNSAAQNFENADTELLVKNNSSLDNVDIKHPSRNEVISEIQNAINSDRSSTDYTLSFENKSNTTSQASTGSMISYNALNSTSKDNTDDKARISDREYSSDNSSTSFSQNNPENNYFNISAYENEKDKANKKEATIMSDEEDFVDPHIQQLVRSNNSSKANYNKSFEMNPINVELANARNQYQGNNKGEREPFDEESDEDEATTPTMATFKKLELSNNQNSSIQNSKDFNPSRSVITQNQATTEVKPSTESNWETAYNDLLSSKDIDFEDDIMDDKSDADNLYSSRTSFSSDADEKNIIDKLSSNEANSFSGDSNKWIVNKSRGHSNGSNTENEENPHSTQLITENQNKDRNLQVDSFQNSARPDSEAVEYSVNKVQITDMYPSTSSAVVSSNEGKRASGSQRSHWSTGINLVGAVLKRESMKLDRQSIAASSEAGSEQWFDPDDDWASQDDTYRRSLMNTPAEVYSETSQYHNGSDDPMSNYYEEESRSTSHQKKYLNAKTTSDYYYKQSNNHVDSYYHNQSDDNTPRSEYFNQVPHNRISDSSSASESSSYKNSNSTQNTAHEDYDFKASYIDDNEDASDYYATKLHTEPAEVNESAIHQNNLEYSQLHANRSQFQIDSDNEEGEGEIVVFMDQTHNNSRVRPDSDYDIDGKIGRMEFQSMVSTEEFKTIDIQNTPSSQYGVEAREIVPPESPAMPVSPIQSRAIIDSKSKPESTANIPESNEYNKPENSSNNHAIINDNSSNKFEIPDDDDDTPPLPHDPNKPRVEDISRYMNTLPAVESAYVEHDVKKQRISKKPSADEQTSGDRGIPNAHEINFDVLPDPLKDNQLDNMTPSKISISSAEASSFGKMYIGVSGAHNMLLPLPKEITYVRCVISDGEYEYMSRYEILGPQILMDYECIVDTRPGMIITVSLHVRPDYHVKPRTGWSKWFTSIRKQKEHLSGYVHPDDGAIGQTRFAVDHMVPACHKKTYEANFDCFNSWYARTNRERARREQYGDEEDILKIVGKLTVEMLYLPVSSPSVQVPRSLRECDLTLKIRQWHSTCWHSGYLSTRCQGLKIWERRYYRLIGSQLVGYDSELDEVEKQVWDRYNIADVIRLSAAADKVIISLVEEDDPDKIFKPESIHDENNKGFFRLSFSDFYLDCVSDDANESEEWVKTLKSMIGRVPLRLPFTN